MNITLTDELQQKTEQWIDALPEEWQTWLIENVERGCSPQELVQILAKNGFVFDAQANSQPVSEVEPQPSQSHLEDDIIQLLLDQVAPMEIVNQLFTQSSQTQQQLLKQIENIQQSSAFKKLQHTHHQLKKREWLIASLDQLAQLNPQYNKKIPRIKTPSFQIFMQNYYSQHRPVILQHGIDHWPALKKWTPDYFAKTIGDGIIEVQMNRDQVKDFERKSPALKQQISMKDFVEKVKNAGESNNFYMTANNTQKSQQSTAPLYQDILDFGKGYCNMAQKNSLSFLWLGPKGTFTPLHHDLTNNMLVQIYGRKKVTLIPALQTPNLYNDRWVFSEISDPRSVDLSQFPNYKHITPVECIIGPGEALFIPIGWWHTVESLDISISVSFTHFNAPNQFVGTFPRAPDE